MSGTHKGYKGMAMEGCIASWYAANTGRDRRRFLKVARAVGETLPPGARILEVAPGPGYLAIEIARSGGYHVTGLDISRSFVRIAAENAARSGVQVDFRRGDAAHMPFSEASFDHVVCMAAFKNFSDPVGALDEIHRVLVPGGTASIHDLRKDASLADIDEEIRTMRLSRLNAALTRWTFRSMLLKNAYDRASLETMVSRSRFATGRIVEEGIGFELRLGKSGLPRAESADSTRSVDDGHRLPADVHQTIGHAAQ